MPFPYTFPFYFDGFYTWRIERKVDGGEWQVLEEAIQIDPVLGEFIYDDENGFVNESEYCYQVKNVVPDDSEWSNTDCVVFVFVVVDNAVFFGTEF